MEVEEGAGGGGEEGGTAAGDRRPRGRGHRGRGRGRSRDRDRSRGRGRGRCWPSLVKSPKQFQRFGYYSPVAVRRRSLQLSLSPVKSRGRGISRLAADRVLVAPLLGEPQQPDEDTEGQQPNEDTEGQQQDDTEGRQQHAASTSAAGPQDDDQQEGHPSYPGPRKRRRLHGVRTFTCSQEDPKVEIKQEPVRKSVFDRIGPKVERGCAEQTRVKSAVVKIERGQVYDFVPESKVKSYIVPYAHDGESDAESSESAESKVKTEPKPEAELKVRTRPIAEPKEKPEPKVKDRLVAEPKVKPEHKAKDRSVAEAKVKTEPQVKDRSVAEPKVKPEPKDRSVAEPKEKPEPKAKDSSVAEAKVKTEAKVKDRSVAEAKPEPAAHSYADAAAGRSDSTAGPGEQAQGTKELVLGIDLGTTNSVVAVVQDGDVEVLVNDICNRLTPSCVHYSDVRQVGEGALRLAITDPDKTVRNIKRALGRSHADLVADATRPLGPVKVALDPTNKRNALIAIEGELLPPEEVAATLLMELKKAAEAQLGCAVGKAVIAVPTYFNTAQRQAVIDAGYLAGLKVSQLVNEPTAAAMAYAHGRNFNKEIVVVDVGGGGCSVSVVCVQNDAVGVRASTSERLPGGEDFDGLMVEHIKQMIKSTLSKDVADDRSYEILRSNFERSKQKLSRIPLSTISTFLPGVDVECNIDVKREMFESVCGGSFKVIASAVKSIVKASKVPVIGEVILIGGSTRIPLLRSLIQDELGAKIGKAVNPDEAVAKGAALLGAGSVSLLQELVCAKTTLSTDNMSYSLKGNIAIPRDLDADIFKKVLKILQNDTPVIRWNPISLQIQPRININGVFEFIDPGGRTVHTIPIGCLSYRARKKCFEKLRDQAAQEQLEHDRVNEKNLLENALREQLCNEVGEPLYSVEHSEKVAQKLKWLEENPHASLIEILKHKEDLHQSNIFWKQEMARRKEEECKSKLVTVFHNILDRKISEDDVARDLEKKLRDRCADFFERVKNGVVKGVKEYEAIFETISKESSDLDAERLKRQVILRNLDDKLRAVMFVDERDPVFQEAKMFQEKWAKRWEWVQRNPVDTADNFQHYFTQVSEDLLRLAILREAVTKKLSVEEAVNVNQFTREDDVDATQEPNQDRPVDNLAVIWDKMILAAGAVNHIQTEASPSPSTSESTLLSCLSRALAVQLLREAQDAVLLIIQTATVRCGLAALALRFADATGEAVERLLLVRRVNVLANPGEEGNLLAHDFLRLCDKSRVNWREVVIGLNTDTVSDKTAAAFVARLRQSAAAAGAGEMPVVASGALPLDEKVVMRLHEAAAMDRFDGEISLAVSEVFCGLDSLRTLFVVGGRWFPLLQNHCRGLEDGVDPWVTYESSLLFLHTYRQGVCTALKQVAWRDVSFQKQALHLWGEIQSDWVQSFFWCVVELFVDLFENTTKKFSPGLLFEERCRLALLASDDSRLKLDLLNKLRCSVSAGQAWGQADERYLSLVVNLCVDTTLSVLEQYKEGLRWSYPLFENLLPFVARGTTRRRPAEPLPPLADPQLAAELHRLKEGFLGTQHPAFPSPQALLLHCSGAGHFSTISKSLRQLFALPIQPPSKGWRATDQLSTITRRLSTCSPDCLPDAIVVASSPRGAQDKRILKLAVQILNQVT